MIILHENSPNWRLKYDNGEVQVSDDEKKIQNLWIEFDCRSIWVERAATLRDEMTHPTAHIRLDQPPLVPDVEALLPQMTHPTLDLINPQWHLLSQRPPSTNTHQGDQED